MPVRRLWLIDNSVTQRVHRSSAVADALAELLVAGEWASCLPQILEAGFSARGVVDHRSVIAGLHAGTVFLPPDAHVAAEAIDLQGRLFEAGLGRAVGVSDLQIAATALGHSDAGQRVTVVHYDADFDHLAAVRPELETHWIVPRGAVA